MPPAPSRPTTLRGEDATASEIEQQDPAPVEAVPEAPARAPRTAAARRAAMKKTEEPEVTAVQDEAKPTRAGRPKRGAAVAAAASPQAAPVAEEKPKRRGKKAASTATASAAEDEKPPVYIPDTFVSEDEEKVNSTKKRKISEERSAVAVVAPQEEIQITPRLSEDEIEIEADHVVVVAPPKSPAAAQVVVVAEAAFSPGTAPVVQPDSGKKRQRSPAIDKVVSPLSESKRRKMSQVGRTETLTPPPEVPSFPVESVLSGTKNDPKSPFQMRSPIPAPAALVASRRGSSPKTAPAVEASGTAAPSYAESLELLRKELPEIEAVLRMDQEEATASAAPSAEPEEAVVGEPAQSDSDLMVVDARATTVTGDEELPRRTSGKRKRSSQSRTSNGSAAPALVASSSSENLFARPSVGATSGVPRPIPPVSSKMPANKALPSQKGAVDEKVKKVIENRNQKEQERLQKQLEKIKKQEEKQTRLQEQKSATAVQDKVKEAQRRKEELKKKQQDKKKTAAAASATPSTTTVALPKKATEEPIVDTAIPEPPPVPEAAPKSTPLKSFLSKFSGTTQQEAAVVKDTPSKSSSSIKSIFAALNPLSLLSFGSAKKRSQEELPKPTILEPSVRRQSAPGSPSVSKSPLFTLTTPKVASPARASTGSNQGFDNPPSASKKTKKSKTPKKGSAKKVTKNLFGWKPVTAPAEPVPIPFFASSSSGTSANSKKVNLSPSDLPSPGPPPAVSKPAAEIMPPPKLPAIGSPSWIRMQTKDKEKGPASPYQSPEKSKPVLFHDSPDFQYQIDDYSSDQDSPGKRIGPEWTKKEQLWDALVRQSNVDPDDIFGTDFPKTCDLVEIFSTDKTTAEERRRYRHRTSSGNWSRDELQPREQAQYKRRMGYARSPTK